MKTTNKLIKGDFTYSTDFQFNDMFNETREGIEIDCGYIIELCYDVYGNSPELSLNECKALTADGYKLEGIYTDLDDENDDGSISYYTHYFFNIR